MARLIYPLGQFYNNSCVNGLRRSNRKWQLWDAVIGRGVNTAFSDELHSWLLVYSGLWPLVMAGNAGLGFFHSA